MQGSSGRNDPAAVALFVAHGPSACLFEMSKFLPPPLHHYDNLTLLGPPKMRGAIVFSGSSHPVLVDGICDRLGMKPGVAQLSKFANGETSVQIRSLSRLPCVFAC